MSAPATPPSKQAPATRTPDLGGAEGATGAQGAPPQSGAPEGVQFQPPEGWTDPMEDLDQIAGKPKPKKRDDQGRFKGDQSKQRRSGDAAEGEGGDAGDGAAEGGDAARRQARDAGGQQGDQQDSGDDGAAADGGEGAHGDDKAFLESGAYKRSKPLREAYDKLRESHTTLERQVNEMKVQLEQGDFNTALADENRTLKDRIKQYQAIQVVKDFKESEPYKEKFINPLTRMLDTVAREIDGIEIDLGNGQIRKAMKQDFLDLIEIPSNVASKRAKALFGEDMMPWIMQMRGQIRMLNDERRAAVQEAEQNSEEMARKQIAEQAERQRHNQRVWVAADQKIVSRYPDLFGEIEGDTEHNELMGKGLQEVDYALHADPKITPEQRLTAMAFVRRKAAAFNPMVRKLRAYEDRIEELEEEIAKLKDGDPDAGGGGGGGEGGKGSDKYVSAAEDPDAPWNKK